MNDQVRRSEVPEEETWDLTDLYATEDEWERELRAVDADIATVTAYQGRLGEGARVFRACLEAQEELMQRLMRVGSYAYLRMAVDGICRSNQAAVGRVLSLRSRIEGSTSFVRSEALALPEGTLQHYLQEDAELESFRPAVQRMIEEKPYTLHPGTESVLASLNEVLDAPAMIYRQSKTSDMSFDPVADGEGQEHPMSFSAYEGKYERSPDPVLRRNAFASFTTGLQNYENTYGATWGTEVRKNVVLAEVRGFPSAIDMMLSWQQVPRDIYDRIHDIILSELAPHMRRYARLRREVVGLQEMLYCDLEAPLDPDYRPEITFEDASTVIREGLQVLGSEYDEIIAAALADRWVDRADNIGKSTGAFCNSVYGVHPYVMITWNDSMRGALTLAHELGHAGQGVLSQRNQRLAASRPSMFFIEAPSTANELLVGDYILQQSDDVRMRRWVTEQLLMTYHHNFVRHLIEGELQRRIYEMAEDGQPINAGILSQVQGCILEEFWGDVLTVDDGAQLTWMRQPHYYRGLYPYSYAAGLTIGTSVASAVRDEGERAARRWPDVLRAGGTKKPLELAEMAGVDMRAAEPIREAVKYVGSLVDEMEETHRQ